MGVDQPVQDALATVAHLELVHDVVGLYLYVSIEHPVEDNTGDPHAAVAVE